MKVTNRYNLPESMVKAAGRSHRPDKMKLSPSAIISPPLIRSLTIEHYDHIETDVADNLTAMMGTGFHLLMEQHKPKNSLNEMPVSTTYCGYEINGIIDQYDPVKKVIRDYKTTSVWSIIDGAKPEWSKQLNIYAWILRRNGMLVDKIEINALARDWVKSKSYDRTYPQIPFKCFELPVWNDETVTSLIDLWIRRYENREACTGDERWHSGPKFAVMKKGRKSALRVLDTKKDAEDYKSVKGGDFIQERPGKNTRCESYCQVNKWCPFWVEHEKLQDK